jgi:hypothetical protein
MKLVTTVPPNSRLVRDYPGETSIAELERDAQLLADAGLSPIIVQADSLALYREQTSDEQLVEIARENDPRVRRAALQREIDDALEPHDPGARRRDRAPATPAPMSEPEVASHFHTLGAADFTGSVDADAAVERHLENLDGHRGLRVIPAEAPHAIGDVAERVRE